MKKSITILLTVILCVVLSNPSVLAEELNDNYTEKEAEFIHTKYKGNEYMLDSVFCNDNAIGYMTIVHEIEQNNFLNWLVEKSAELAGEKLEKKDYAEILANLIMMQEGDFAEQIENQSQYDDLKDGADYAEDIIEIATDYIGASDSFDNVSSIIDAASGGKDVLVENLEQGKYYKTTIQSFAHADSLLKAVSQYVDNSELRSVADSLISANEQLMQKRLEYLIDTMDSLVEYEAEFFVENLSFDLLKSTDIYLTDDTVKWFVDGGEQLVTSFSSALSTGKFAFHATMLAGNVYFGTANTYNRYEEIKTLTDIAESLIKANEKIEIPQNFTSDIDLGIIREKCDYYKLLLVTHARGEYLIYQLLINDAGVLSSLRTDRESADDWYNSQIDVLSRYYEILDSIFEIPESIDYDIEDASSFAGNWTVDSERTMDANGMSMTQLFGTAYTDYGSSMVIREDRAFSYYIGAGIGGNGTWKEKDGRLLYEIKTYEDGAVQTGTLVSDADDFLLMQIDEYNIWWHREEATESEEREAVDNIFKSMPSDFIFTSGAGAWQTQLTVREDGSFSGQYIDSDMGDTGEKYPNGTTYICDFDGKFSVIEKMDECTYSIKLDELNTARNPGEEYYENDIRYICSEPYGFENADEFIIFLPGKAMSDIPEEFKIWLNAFMDVSSTETLPYYGIYNVNGQAGFIGGWN